VDDYTSHSCAPPHTPYPRGKPSYPQDCDEAIEVYTRTRSAYYSRAPPSTYRTTSQRLMDVLGATFRVTVGVLGWTVSVPGKLWSLRKWSRDDWSGWWAGVKKMVKEEAHHYWVRRGRGGMSMAGSSSAMVLSM